MPEQRGSFTMRIILIGVFMVFSAFMFGTASGKFMVTAQDAGVTKAASVAGEAVEITATEATQYTKAFSSLADKFGLWAALTVALMAIFVVTGWLRERRMAVRISDLEDTKAKNEVAVATALTSNGAHLENMANTQKAIMAIQQKQLEQFQTLTVEFRCRPCMNPGAAQSLR